MAQDMAKGQIQEKQKIARQMLKKGIPVKDIAEITNLSQEGIEKLRI